MGSFIRGIEESFIRQRQLEAETLTLAEAIKHAEILKRAHENARNFEMHEDNSKSIVAIETKSEIEHDDTEEHCAITTKQSRFTPKPNAKKCWNCGYTHLPQKCLAIDQRCYNCN